MNIRRLLLLGACTVFSVAAMSAAAPRPAVAYTIMLGSPYHPYADDLQDQMSGLLPEVLVGDAGTGMLLYQGNPCQLWWNSLTPQEQAAFCFCKRAVCNAPALRPDNQDSSDTSDRCVIRVDAPKDPNALQTTHYYHLSVPQGIDAKTYTNNLRRVLTLYSAVLNAWAQPTRGLATGEDGDRSEAINKAFFELDASAKSLDDTVMVDAVESPAGTTQSPLIKPQDPAKVVRVVPVELPQTQVLVPQDTSSLVKEEAARADELPVK